MVLDFFSVLINHIRVKWRDDKYSHVLIYVNAYILFYFMAYISSIFSSFYLLYIKKKKNQFQT